MGDADRWESTDRVLMVYDIGCVCVCIQNGV